MALDPAGQLELQESGHNGRDGRARLPDQIVQFHRTWPEQFQQLAPDALRFLVARLFGTERIG